MDFSGNGSQNIMWTTDGRRCFHYSNINIFQNTPFNRFNQVLSVFLLFCGVTGNLIGAYAAASVSTEYPSTGGSGSRKRNSVNQLLITLFFAVNFINSLLFLVDPILKLYGHGYHNPIWNGKVWITYLANFNYPIIKPLISFSFWVYLTLFSNQLLAVAYPFKYKRIVTMRRVSIILLVALLYCIVWYIPTYQWFNVKKLLICDDDCYTHHPNYPTPRIQLRMVNPKIQNNSNPPDHRDLTHKGVVCHGHYLYTFVWPAKFYGPTTRVSLAWNISQICREVFVNILPFVIMLVVKARAVMWHRKIASSAYTTSSQLSPTCDNAITHLTVKTPPSVQGSSITNASQCSSMGVVPKEYAACNRQERKKASENRQHKRTLLILTWEFVFLMLPITLALMVQKTLRDKYTRAVLAPIYLSLTMLQFVYVSSTFYINLAFNEPYRNAIIALFCLKYNRVRRKVSKFMGKRND